MKRTFSLIGRTQRMIILWAFRVKILRIREVLYAVTVIGEMRKPQWFVENGIFKRDWWW